MRPFKYFSLLALFAATAVPLILIAMALRCIAVAIDGASKAFAGASLRVSIDLLGFDPERPHGQGGGRRGR